MAASACTSRGAGGVRAWREATASPCAPSRWTTAIRRTQVGRGWCWGCWGRLQQGASRRKGWWWLFPCWGGGRLTNSASHITHPPALQATSRGSCASASTTTCDAACSRWQPCCQTPRPAAEAPKEARRCRCGRRRRLPRCYSPPPAAVPAAAVVAWWPGRKQLPHGWLGILICTHPAASCLPRCRAATCPAAAASHPTHACPTRPAGQQRVLEQRLLAFRQRAGGCVPQLRAGGGGGGAAPVRDLCRWVEGGAAGKLDRGRGEGESGGGREPS
jgi:hypothetical protein